MQLHFAGSHSPTGKSLRLSMLQQEPTAAVKEGVLTTLLQTTLLAAVAVVEEEVQPGRERQRALTCLKLAPVHIM